ncbi:MAG TPA: DUF350 domain-containing protein [Pyrinomonadaceae bacterium]|jgi:uncharacterized membrane protein YjfL (UPF0719 family)
MHNADSLAAQANNASVQTFLGFIVNLNDLGGVLLATLVFTIFGLVVFAVAFMIMGKAAPFSIRKELEDDQNVALGIVMGAVILGIALIIAAAIHG